jgi:hypothetical protein
VRLRDDAGRLRDAGRADGSADAGADGKIRRIPIILVHSPFWKGLLEWIDGTLLPEGMIGVDDPKLIQVIDDPQASSRRSSTTTMRAGSSPRRLNERPSWRSKRLDRRRKLRITMRTPPRLDPHRVRRIAIGQSTPRPRPPGTTPLEEPPPLPPSSPTDAGTMPRSNRGAGSTARRGRPDDRGVQRQRQGLHDARHAASHGRAYVMIDQRGDGTFTRMDTLEPGMRVPQWVIFEF